MVPSSRMLVGLSIVGVAALAAVALAGTYLVAPRYGMMGWGMGSGSAWMFLLALPLVLLPFLLAAMLLLREEFPAGGR